MRLGALTEEFSFLTYMGALGFGNVPPGEPAMSCVSTQHCPTSLQGHISRVSPVTMYCESPEKAQSHIQPREVSPGLLLLMLSSVIREKFEVLQILQV